MVQFCLPLLKSGSPRIFMFDVVFLLFLRFLFNLFPKDPLICPRKGVYIVYHAFSPLVQG